MTHIEISKEELKRLAELQRDQGSDFIGTSFNAIQLQDGKASEVKGKITAIYDVDAESKPDRKSVTVTPVLNINNIIYLFDLQESESDFHRIKQDRFTNQLTSLTTKGENPDITGSIKLSTKDISAKIEGFDKLIKHTKGINSDTWRVFDFLMLICYKQGIENNTVRFTLEQYMKLRGYKPTPAMKKKFRRKLTESLDIMIAASIKYRYKDKQHKERERCRNLLQEYDHPVSSEGYFYVVFNQEFGQDIERMNKWMYLPQEFWKLNIKYNPHSTHFLRKASYLKSINLGQQAVTISVKKLLQASPEFPDYKDIKETGEIRRRIIEPFERDLDAIKCLTWSYVNNTGKEVERSKIKGYQAFIKLTVKFKWVNYPDISSQRTLGNKSNEKEGREIKNDTD